VATAGRSRLQPAGNNTSAATALGRDCIATWLVGSSVVLALIFFAVVQD